VLVLVVPVVPCPGVEVDVGLHGNTVVLVVGGLPPDGGFWPKQSDLEHLPVLADAEQ